MAKLKLSTTESKPTAHLTVKKSRLKVYNQEGSTYFLKDGTEFEIELFNPTSGTVLAKISLNGKNVSNGGLVVKPGQRLFLERYLDTESKFLFQTYEVSGNNEEVKQAIKNNGDLKVEFFKEKEVVYNPWIINLPQRTIWNSPWDQQYGGNVFYNSSIPIGDSSGGADYLNFTSSSVTNDAALTKTLGDIPNLKAKKGGVLRSSGVRSSIETGRVEKGSQSDQKFTTVDMEFEYSAFQTVNYNILPESRKISTAEDVQVKQYCTNCGAKQRKEHKFCAHCGSKN